MHPVGVKYPVWAMSSAEAGRCTKMADPREGLVIQPAISQLSLALFTSPKWNEWENQA